MLIGVELAFRGSLSVTQVILSSLYISVIVHRQARDIATRCWEVGDDIRLQVSQDPEAYIECKGWLQRGLQLVQALQKSHKPIAWMRDLHVAILRSMGELALHILLYAEADYAVRSHLTVGKDDRAALDKAKALFFDLTKLVDSRVSY